MHLRLPTDESFFTLALVTGGIGRLHVHMLHCALIRGTASQRAWQAGELYCSGSLESLAARLKAGALSWMSVAKGALSLQEQSHFGEIVCWTAPSLGSLTRSKLRAYAVKGIAISFSDSLIISFIAHLVHGLMWLRISHRQVSGTGDMPANRSSRHSCSTKKSGIISESVSSRFLSFLVRDAFPWCSLVG